MTILIRSQEKQKSSLACQLYYKRIVKKKMK